MRFYLLSMQARNRLYSLVDVMSLRNAIEHFQLTSVLRLLNVFTVAALTQ
jgi:hypothetical protein